VLGARHALEPDHLAAVSTLVAERPRPGGAAVLGALWGLGHTAAILAVGVVLLAARMQLDPAAATAAEALVAVMLIVLGVRGVVLAVRPPRDPAPHRHRVAVRPLVIGLIHGLAGSGALTALAVAAMPTRAAAIGYLGAFGVGSSLGMALVSGAAGMTLARLTVGRGRAAVMATAGAMSVIVGIAWGAALLTSTG
jgi:high-affinity nickel-transport protein